MLAEIIYQSVEFLAHEQLSGVRRSLLADDVVEVVRGLAVHDVLLEVVVLIKQVVNKTHTVVTVDSLRETALTKVEVDQYCPFTDISQRQRKVKGGIGLTFARRGGNRLYHLLAILQEERDITMQQSEGFRDHIGTIGCDDNLVVDTCGRFLGYLSQYRQRRGTFHIGLRAQFGVEEANAEHNQRRQCKANDQCHEDIHHKSRGGLGRNRRLDNFGVGDGDSQIHGCLLTFAEEVEVQFLFNLLLTLHFGHGLGLCRHGGNLATCTGLLATCILQTHGGGIE